MRAGRHPRRALRGARPKTARFNWRSRFTWQAREGAVFEGAWLSVPRPNWRHGRHRR